MSFRERNFIRVCFIYRVCKFFCKKNFQNWNILSRWIIPLVGQFNYVILLISGYVAIINRKHLWKNIWHRLSNMIRITKFLFMIKIEYLTTVLAALLKWNATMIFTTICLNFNCRCCRCISEFEMDYKTMLQKTLNFMQESEKL